MKQDLWLNRGLLLKLRILLRCGLPAKPGFLLNHDLPLMPALPSRPDLPLSSGLRPKLKEPRYPLVQTRNPAHGKNRSALKVRLKPRVVHRWRMPVRAKAHDLTLHAAMVIGRSVSTTFVRRAQVSRRIALRGRHQLAANSGAAVTATVRHVLPARQAENAAAVTATVQRVPA
ncbi:MAG: hypothetical protein ACRC7C_03345, partial [Beijerinckiaceae bacterium]